MSTDRIRVSAADLAAALEGFHVEVTSPFRTVAGATSADGVIADPDAVGDALFATLARMAAHREPEPEVTRDLTVTGRQIAGALEGLPVEVEIGPGVARSPRTGGWLAVVEGTVAKPGAVAAAILTRVPGFGQEKPAGPDTGTPRFASDLQGAIARLGPVRVHPVDGGPTNAVILYPGTIAGRILQAIRQEPDGPAGEIHPLDRAGGEADEELAAIASAVGHLECLDGLAQRRVLRYLAGRYGIED